MRRIRRHLRPVIEPHCRRGRRPADRGRRHVHDLRTGGTPGLNTDAPLFGVSAVSKIGTGQYRISYDSNVFPDSSTTKNLILIPKLYTTTNGQRMVGIADRQNTYFDVSIYDNTTLVDNDFTVEMF